MNRHFRSAYYRPRVHSTTNRDASFMFLLLVGLLLVGVALRILS